MQKQELHLVFASDNNYAQPLGVAIYSLLENFSSEKYKPCITILDGGILEDSKKKLKTIASMFDTSISFIVMEKDRFENFPVFNHYSIAIYYRLIIPEILRETHKAIYLDCDILVLGNIAELYEIELGDLYFGAVEDFISKVHLSTTKVSFYKDVKKMLNSGVLLLNLQKMREDHFVEESLSFINKYKDEVVFPDQDALSYVGRDRWLELDKSWNTQIDISQTKITPPPNILHYTNSYKPWHAFYRNYYQKKYNSSLKKAWPGYTIKPVSLKIALKQISKYIPFSVRFVRAVKKLQSRS